MPFQPGLHGESSCRLHLFLIKQFDGSLARDLRIFAKETKYEFLKLLRNRSFSLAVIGFPIMFYLLFGVTIAARIAMEFIWLDICLADMRALV